MSHITPNAALRHQGFIDAGSRPSTPSQHVAHQASESGDSVEVEGHHISRSVYNAAVAHLKNVEAESHTFPFRSPRQPIAPVIKSNGTLVGTGNTREVHALKAPQLEQLAHHFDHILYAWEKKPTNVTTTA